MEHLILCAWEYDAPPDAETVPMVINMTNIEIPSLTTIFAFILSDSLLFTYSRDKATLIWYKQQT